MLLAPRLDNEPPSAGRAAGSIGCIVGPEIGIHRHANARAAENWEDGPGAGSGRKTKSHASKATSVRCTTTPTIVLVNCTFAPRTSSPVSTCHGGLQRMCHRHTPHFARGRPSSCGNVTGWATPPRADRVQMLIQVPRRAGGVVVVSVRRSRGDTRAPAWPRVLCWTRVQSLRQLGPSLCLSMFGVFGLAASGCKDDPDVFVCSSPDQCNGGICHPTRYCSFPDPTCGSRQRYGSLAGDGLADTCVRGSMSGDEGEDVGSESESASAT